MTYLPPNSLAVRSPNIRASYSISLFVVDSSLIMNSTRSPWGISMTTPLPQLLGWTIRPHESPRVLVWKLLLGIQRM